MQGIVDKEYRPGFFILTGSQNFLLYEKISQTLAGRMGLLTLLPFTVDELTHANRIPQTLEELLFKGSYPRLYVQVISVKSWVSQYISLYVERDVRQILNIGDTTSFEKFIYLCAARTGQILNYAELARDANISPNTAKAWISILQTSYIIHLVQPYHKRFSKRMIKSPKLYFYDTGLVCSLLNISASELFAHPMRGALFETFVISEMLKYFHNKGEKHRLFYWRDVQGHEIDCILERQFEDIIPVEIKSSRTVSPEFFKNLVDWQIITNLDVEKYLVYSGDQDQKRIHAEIYAWNHIHTMLGIIFAGNKI